MKPNLGRDLEETMDFFNSHFKTKDGFCHELEFIIRSNSYVRILEENIKEINFPGYNVYTDINQIINSDIKDDFEKRTRRDYKIIKTRREYKLTVSFDKL